MGGWMSRMTGWMNVKNTFSVTVLLSKVKRLRGGWGFSGYGMSAWDHVAVRGSEAPCLRHSLEDNRKFNAVCVCGIV